MSEISLVDYYEKNENLFQQQAAVAVNRIRGLIAMASENPAENTQAVDWESTLIPAGRNDNEDTMDDALRMEANGEISRLFAFCAESNGAVQGTDEGADYDLSILLSNPDQPYIKNGSVSTLEHTNDQLHRVMFITVHAEIANLGDAYMARIEVLDTEGVKSYALIQRTDGYIFGSYDTTTHQEAMDTQVAMEELLEPLPDSQRLNMLSAMSGGISYEQVDAMLRSIEAISIETEDAAIIAETMDKARSLYNSMMAKHLQESYSGENIMQVRHIMEMHDLIDQKVSDPTV